MNQADLSGGLMDQSFTKPVSGRARKKTKIHTIATLSGASGYIQFDFSSIRMLSSVIVFYGQCAHHRGMTDNDAIANAHFNLFFK